MLRPCRNSGSYQNTDVFPLTTAQIFGLDVASDFVKINALSRFSTEIGSLRMPFGLPCNPHAGFKFVLPDNFDKNSFLRRKYI